VKNELLPIGSIVRANGQDIMICAYLKKDANVNNEHYDYACCIYPTGLAKDSILIKKEQIQKIIFIGYQDERFVELKNNMETSNA